ncbi:hypothetical protein GIB67_016884 [Kingdonia uniflora]|uniref:Kinesin motor domain-containing protein n=1 Tax=Kingdonia uniflora TaxID=39325 RepID=A0A7J7M3C8_9MAGN|nr:hypothetical protein GIB67_016884 [Kingdonia uniflora]
MNGEKKIDEVKHPKELDRAESSDKDKEEEDIPNSPETPSTSKPSSASTPQNQCNMGPKLDFDKLKSDAGDALLEIRGKVQRKAKIGREKERGLNRPQMQEEVKNFMRVNKFGFVGLLETKIKDENYDRLKKNIAHLWSNVNNYLYSASSRMMMFWNAEKMNVVVLSMSPQGLLSKSQQPELAALDCGILARNYNCVAYASEKVGRDQPANGDMAPLRGLIDQIAVTDLKEDLRSIQEAMIQNVGDEELEGGLGIKRLKEFNDSLMLRTLWNFVSGVKNPWTVWDRNNYLKDCYVRTVEIPSECSWALGSLLKKRYIVMKYCRIIVGNGNDTLLWHDPWLGEGVLKLQMSRNAVMLPGLLNNSKVKDIIKYDGNWLIPDGRIRSVELRSMWSKIQIQQKPDTIEKDTMIWTLTANGGLKSNTAWKELSTHQIPPSWISVVWDVNAIPRHSFILWLTLRNREEYETFSADILLRWKIKSINKPVRCIRRVLWSPKAEIVVNVDRCKTLARSAFRGIIRLKNSMPALAFNGLVDQNLDTNEIAIVAFCEGVKIMDYLGFKRYEVITSSVYVNGVIDKIWKPPWKCLTQSVYVNETIESSPCGDNSEGEAVNLSQLNLIDLAGSESSRAETTGIRRKEGSYINKSLLTLGTVISKLTDGRSAHVPYRDSKLTRLLQSSLSGHGRVSLICNVTPSSSNSEETHNTLKFAHRAKHVEIQASQNKIIDEKSLIKKYQNEIYSLKEELERLRRGIVAIPSQKKREDNFVLLKQKLAYLPYKRRDLILDEESIDLYGSLECIGETTDATFKEEKKSRKHGLLNWFKLRKRDSLDGDKSSGTKSITSPSTPQAESINCPSELQISNSLLTESTPSADLLMEAGQDREDLGDNFFGREMSLASIKTINHIDLLKEQQNILSGEVALHSSALKRLSDESATDYTRKEQVHVEMGILNNEIKLKNQQISLLEKQIVAAIRTSDEKMDTLDLELSPSFAELVGQLNEKSFELEVMM